MRQTELFQQAKQLRQRNDAQIFPLPKEQQTNLFEIKKILSIDSETKVAAFIYQPAYLPSQGIVLNFRGSGFMHHWTPHDRAFARSLTFATNYTVIDVDYPLAPEHPFPAAVNASFAVFKYVQTHYQEFCATGTQLAVMGHSSGGNLAVVTQLLAKRNGLKLADKLLLDFPVLDLDTDAAQKNYPAGQGIPVEESRLMNSFYLSDSTQQLAGNPLISPILATKEELLEFPPTEIHTAEFDSLRDEAEQFAQHLVSAYVHVNLCRYPKSYHGFTVVKTGAGARSFNDFIQFIQQ
ncbi:alpha/beta hydrolase [Liquorilactobacillus nagelii]|jgi:acetyl esterase|uniref:alpha/beta hydrolase n=1 Tax=Liquorilactobacillus nagelii TaxID=82688 RepID=UPI0039ECC3C5